MEHNGNVVGLSVNGDSASNNTAAFGGIVGVQGGHAGDNCSVLSPGDCNTYEHTQSEISAQEILGADSDGDKLIIPTKAQNDNNEGADDVNLRNLKTEILDPCNFTTDIREISTNDKILLENQPYGDEICENGGDEENSPIFIDTDGMSDGKSRVMPMEKPLQISKKKKVSDAIRVQKILEELSTKSLLPEQVLGGRYKRQKICSEARTLLLQYAKEISSAILEESCILARHRKSKELNIADVKLIFGNLYLAYLDVSMIASSSIFFLFSEYSLFVTPSFFSFIPLITGKKFDINVSGYQLRASRLSASAALAEDEEEVEAANTLASTCPTVTESPVMKVDEPIKPITEEVEEVREVKKENRDEFEKTDQVPLTDVSGEVQELNDSGSYMREEATQASQFSISFSSQNSQQESQPMDELGGSCMREEATQASQFSISFSAQNSQQESQPMDELGGSCMREEATQASQFSISFSAQNSQQESQPMDELGDAVAKTFNGYDNSVSNSSYVTQDT